jgi:dipeptidyl aminopeptidase/acylaminoacyl peptidase
MKQFFSIAVMFMLVGLAACNKSAEKQPELKKAEPPTRQIKHYSIEQFMNTISFTHSSFSHDEGKILYTSNQSGIYNVYRVPVQGGAAESLTDSQKESYFLETAFPQDNRILFTADRGGNEIDHLYLREEDGTIKDLTPEPRARVSFLGWGHDLKSFFYSSNQRDVKFMDIYEMDITAVPFTSHLFFKNDGGFDNEFRISANKRYVALLKTDTSHNSDIYLWDREKSQLKNITTHEGNIFNSAQAFDGNSENLYFLSDENSEFKYLKRYNLASGNLEKVVEKKWDIVAAYFSWQGTYRVIVTNNDGRFETELFDTRKQEPVQLPQFPGSNVTSVNISRSEKRLAFYLSGSDSPRNLYVYDFSQGSCQQLTESMNSEIDKEDLVKARVIRYPSFDGLKIPAIFYVPHPGRPGEKIPALVWVHGGPGGQSVLSYLGLIQYLVNHGYAVLAVNNRGSSGYGKTFFKADDLKHGADDLEDCVRARAFLKSSGVVDENKIGIIGGSYGGYMVLAALTFKPEAFAVGVDLFGISNWLRTLKSIPAWWEAQRKMLYEEMGNPETQEAYLKKISPLFHADQINKPLMVLQGANDPRVLKVESDEIVAAVKKKGVPVEYVLFEDEGHGFVKTKNQVKAYRAILEFLDTYLKGKKENYVY